MKQVLNLQQSQVPCAWLPVLVVSMYVCMYIHNVHVFLPLCFRGLINCNKLLICNKADQCFKPIVSEVTITRGHRISFVLLLLLPHDQIQCLRMKNSGC